jgi:hypothetical protein
MPTSTCTSTSTSLWMLHSYSRTWRPIAGTLRRLIRHRHSANSRGTSVVPHTALDLSAYSIKCQYSMDCIDSRSGIRLRLIASFEDGGLMEHRSHCRIRPRSSVVSPNFLIDAKVTFPQSLMRPLAPPNSPAPCSAGTSL